MKLKLNVLIVLTLLTGLATKAQDYFPDAKTFNSKEYHALIPVKVGEYTFNKVIAEVTKMGDSRILVFAACERCGLPVMVRFDPESSKALKRAVFYSEATDVMAMAYDKDSFVIIQATKTKPIVRFYSKNKATVDSMTQEKALAYAMKYMGQLE